MSFSKAFTTLSILLVAFFSGIKPTSADITGIVAPNALRTGQPFNVTLLDNGQTYVNQYYVAFGIASSPPAAGQLGTPIIPGIDIAANAYGMTGNGTTDVSLTLPASFQPSACAAAYTLTAAVFGTTTSGATEVDYFNTTVSVASQ